MKKLLVAFSLVLMYLTPYAQKQPKEFATIDTLIFDNSSRHWYGIADKENVIDAYKNQPRYKPSQLKEIANNILLYQKNNGGWPKNYDMRAILTKEQKKKLIEAKNATNTTFDNSTTYSHVDCLAKVYYVTRTAKYKDACLKGIDFILLSQYENGGWPQYFPLRDDYSRRITFNDDIIIGIMTVLKDIIDGKQQYFFVNAEKLEKVKAAFKKGMDCTIKTQVYDKGMLTAWCQQYDENDLTPAWARKFEPRGISNKESSTIVIFLMGINNPDKEIINAIQNAVKWFEISKIYGIRVEKISAPPETSQYKVFKSDKIVVKDSLAPPIWPRYNELETHKPLFCNRDSKVVYSLAEVARERRDGYAWYVYDPQLVLDNYKAWQEKWAPGNNVLKGY